MRHSDNIRKFGREKKVRKALIKSLALSLVNKESIKTTEEKAKALRPFVEKIITLSKKNSLSAKRLVASRLSSDAVIKLFQKIAPRYEKRAGGYTRIVKLPRRKSDGAKMAVIKFV